MSSAGRDADQARAAADNRRWTAAGRAARARAEGQGRAGGRPRRRADPDAEVAAVGPAPAPAPVTPLRRPRPPIGNASARAQQAGSAPRHATSEARPRTYEEWMARGDVDRANERYQAAWTTTTRPLALESPATGGPSRPWARRCSELGNADSRSGRLSAGAGAQSALFSGCILARRGTAPGRASRGRDQGLRANTLELAPDGNRGRIRASRHCRPCGRNRNAMLNKPSSAEDEYFAREDVEKKRKLAFQQAAGRQRPAARGAQDAAPHEVPEVRLRPPAR